LANLMERLAILKPSGQVEPNDLPTKFRAYAPAEPVAVELPVMARLVAAGPGSADVSFTHLSAVERASLPADGLDLRQYIMDLESSLIQSALEEANGIVAHAASLLKMRRTTLVEKMRKYNIRRGDDGIDE